MKLLSMIYQEVQIIRMMEQLVTRLNGAKIILHSDQEWQY